jgi:heat-inducible transcriptional repressor
MALLEKEDYLAKPHTSGGRIPTNKAYEYYANQSNSNSSEFNEREIIKYIDDIFENRNLGIDQIIGETMKVLSEATNLVTISKKSADENELLASISLTQTNDYSAVLLMVTNNNRVINKVIQLPKNQKIDNIITSVNIFNERLKGTKLNEIENKALLLKDIISAKVKDVEFDFKSFVKLMFRNIIKPHTTNYGVSNVVKYDEINQSKQLLENIMKIIEENTI